MKSSHKLLDIALSNATRSHITPQHVHRACLTVAPSHLTRPSSGLSRQIRGSQQSVCQFSVSPCLYKKGGKAAREEKQAAAKDSGKDTGGDDPFDFSTLEADIAAITERLKNDLSKLRAGGRFNPEVLEGLRVQPDKSSKETVKLNDVAQVIPKGRSVQILVGEKDHVKPVTSAITSSNLSLTPHPDPTGASPLMLVINIPPPTAESRKAAVQEAAKAGEKASTSARDARGKQQKKLRGMQLNKSVRPDDLKKAGTQMEKVVEKGTAELKRVVDNAKKVLESG
ncbi:ribosome recycling factor [Hortaea werneckii]|uniref:Ribosome recycling factor domain-containing protein n=1 Tax=Hortaea werneckii TaxID=91943 RepID=A0A3M7I903_HORWE|nr:ribosome recycling factor [Hortaea werneckii]KAI6831212.1 ribosome recycling factor [Hortaea werneckii]KAI6906560.1 ribosome recycling factor [Hortaea werneckii]KAI6924042.1 ribosome recycling factor [Hortaea werneckii]KAI6961569.1 ribosome recycling factor [Hortaea werneckii]